jgi:hypothetical protein
MVADSQGPIAGGFARRRQISCGVYACNSVHGERLVWVTFGRDGATDADNRSALESGPTSGGAALVAASPILSL